MEKKEQYEEFVLTMLEMLNITWDEYVELKERADKNGWSFEAVLKVKQAGENIWGVEEYNI